jgi:hypothetical protein
MSDLRDMNRHYCATCKHMTEHICKCTACGTTIGTPPERDAANDGGLMRDAGADCRAALPRPAKVFPIVPARGGLRRVSPDAPSARCPGERAVQCAADSAERRSPAVIDSTAPDVSNRDMSNARPHAEAVADSVQADVGREIAR